MFKKLPTFVPAHYTGADAFKRTAKAVDVQEYFQAEHVITRQCYQIDLHRITCDLIDSLKHYGVTNLSDAVKARGYYNIYNHEMYEAAFHMLSEAVSALVQQAEEPTLRSSINLCDLLQTQSEGFAVRLEQSNCLHNDRSWTLVLTVLHNGHRFMIGQVPGDDQVEYGLVSLCTGLPLQPRDLQPAVNYGAAYRD